MKKGKTFLIFGIVVLTIVIIACVLNRSTESPQADTSRPYISLNRTQTASRSLKDDVARLLADTTSARSRSFLVSLTPAEVSHLRARVSELVLGMSRDQVFKTIRLPHDFHWPALDIQRNEAYVQPIRLNDTWMITLVWDIKEKTFLRYEFFKSDVWTSQHPS